MAIKATDSVTVYDVTDVTNVRPWYITVLRTSPAPTVATNATESQMIANGWATTEPAIDITKKLYTVQECMFGDGSYIWGEVSLSSSYEAAIEAFNRAAAAEQTATNYIYYDSTNGLQIASASPSTATRRVQITNDAVKLYNDANNHADITSTGMDIIQNNKSVAKFGSSIRLGSTTNVSGDDEFPSSYLTIVEDTERGGTALKFTGTIGSRGMGRIETSNALTWDNGVVNDDYRELRIIGPYGGDNSPKIIFDYDGNSAARGIDIWLSDEKRIYISNTGATVMAGAFYFDTAVTAPLFKSETHVHATAGAIGEYKSVNNASAVSVATSTAVSLVSISLTAGTWIASCHARFPNNSTGYRRIGLLSSVTVDQQVSSQAVNGNTTDLSVTRILRPTATTTYYLVGWQNSGSTLSMPASQQTIQAVRIA